MSIFDERKVDHAASERTSVELLKNIGILYRVASRALEDFKTGSTYQMEASVGIKMRDNG